MSHFCIFLAIVLTVCGQIAIKAQVLTVGGKNGHRGVGTRIVKPHAAI
jgi:hypothetical protein